MIIDENDPTLPSDFLGDEQGDGTTDNQEATGEDLKYNEEEGSFELDADTGDTEYEHPLPYDTAAPQGEDNNSTYDEENPYTQDEYQDNSDQLADGELQIEDIADESVQVDAIDERITDEEEPIDDNTDAEGYPTKDGSGKDENPIF